MSFFSNNYNYDIIIVGGGISGLFTGYKLSETGLRILIIESSERLGGRIKTIHTNDILYESGAARFHKTHTKLLSLINELDLKNDIIELPEKIDYILRKGKKYKTENKLTLNELLNEAILKSKKMKKDKLINITFFQYLVLIFDFETAQFIKDSIGYDAEIIHLNAYAAITMFKNDLFKDNKYFSLKNGLSSIIENLEEKINKKKNIIIKKGTTVKEVYKDHIITTNGDNFNFKDLILTIPSEKIKEIDYFKENSLIDSVKPIKLLRIYAKYPVKDLWFKNINRTITDNYIRHIIPIDYSKGLIMLSYTDDKYCELWKNYSHINEKFLIKSLHKEIIDLFEIEPPNPIMISTEYWENGFHVWDTGYDTNEIYESMIKPTNDNIYICGESYSKKQGWIEGSLETCYEVIQNLPLKGIKIVSNKTKIKRKKILMPIEDIIKNRNLIILDHNGEKPIYDISKWIPKHPGGAIIKNVGVEANKYYLPNKNKKYNKSPYQIFKTIHTKEVIEKYLINENKYVKKVGFLDEK